MACRLPRSCRIELKMNYFAKLSVLSLLVLVALAAAWYVMSPVERATGRAGGETATVRQAPATGRAVPPVAQSTGSAALTDLGLQSIYPATDRDAAAAIIVLGERQADLFSAGDDVFGIATLEQVADDHVVLQTDEGRMELYLQDADMALAADEMPADAYREPGPYGTHAELQQKLRTGELSVLSILQDAAAGGQHGSSPKASLYRKRPQPGSEDRLAVYADARTTALEDQSDLAWAFLDYEPEMRQDGVAGVRLTGHEQLELLNRHGLEYGDVITSVNGRRIDSQAAMMEAMELIGAAQHLELTVERGSQNETISIDK